MSFEEEVGRQLQGRAAGVRVTPDLKDLASRIRTFERSTQRHERLALGAAVVVLASSLGGLAGALANRPHALNGGTVGFLNGNGAGHSKTHPTSKRPSSDLPGVLSVVPPQTVISRQLTDGFNVSASLQLLGSPVGISVTSGARQCVKADVLATTIGQNGLFGGGTAVTALPSLAASGLEILSSGVLQAAGGGQVWWTAMAVGASVARVAAENLGGAAVASTPSDGIAVMEGPLTGQSVAPGDMSAVAEASDGQVLRSMAYVLGSGPTVKGEGVTPQAAGCSFVSQAPAPASASSSQPADPALAGASVVAAFEQAYSADALLGFSANLAAVDGGASLSTPAKETATDNAESVASADETAPRQPAPLVGAAVGVRQVSFLSASEAEVIYVAPSGVTLTGQAVLGSDGIWRVGLPTFCGSVRARVVQGEVPAAVMTACEASP